jgi:transposase InsO family protein
VEELSGEKPSKQRHPKPKPKLVRFHCGYCGRDGHKGETFGFVRDLVLRLRNERHRDAIRANRSDNGSEFRNSRFETFCNDLGLEHQFLSPYTPPQNGVVERKNRTLCEMARTMLDEHRTPRNPKYLLHRTPLRF